MKIKDKVLIVEDEQSISSFISMILTANGYDTIIVNTGEEALTMISSHCPDLIVLDLGLPDMDGLEAVSYTHLQPMTPPPMTSTSYMIHLSFLKTKSHAKAPGVSSGQFCMAQHLTA